jgi:tetratricopeptide (TPR) repeat protein
MRVALMTLAQVEKDLGNLEAAAEAMARAHALHPEDAVALAQLVSYLTQAGRPEDAVTVSAAHAARPRPDIDVLFARSLALARAGRGTEGLAAAKRAAAIDPRHPMGPVYLGTHHLMAGHRAEARAAFERALAIDDATVAAHTALAVLDTEEGRIEEAREHWRRAVALDPREHAKLLTIAGGLWTSGNRAQARPLLELFVASAPTELFATELERARARLAGDGP